MCVAFLALTLGAHTFADKVSPAKTDSAAQSKASQSAKNSPTSADAELVYAVKIDGEIAAPQLSILKRAIRVANSEGAKILILDMNTPGGDLATTLEMMKALGDFKGKTVCYVNSDAISAGSFIAVACDEIIFAPNGVMGAAEAVTSTGSDVDKSMARKITSYLSAKVRSFSGENTRRAQVQRAMNDPDFELTIAKKEIKKKGELLTLTAKEAAEILDGAPLLSSGTEKTLADAAKKSAAKDIQLRELKITSAEIIAKYVSQISPLLLGIGFFLLFMELKSGGFGVMGIIGVVIMLCVFIGANLSGIAGHEEIAVFILGVLMVAVELIFLPGFMLMSITGALLIGGAVVWALADFIPQRGFDYNLEAITYATAKLFLSLIIALVCVILFGGLIKKTPLWKKLELKSCQTNSRAPSDFQSEENDSLNSAVCITDLLPSGQIKMGDKIFDATSQFGHIRKGEMVKVVAKKDFNFVVKKI